MKRLLPMIAILMMTGCGNITHALFPGDAGKPGTNPANVCRATPGVIIFDLTASHGDLLTDDVKIATGETNGQDGVMESVTLCKSNVCTTVNQTSVLPDGTVINIVPMTIEVELAKTNGYTTVTMTVNYSCHG